MKSLVPPFKPAGRLAIAGISLIEVVLAIGILGFAVIPLIGLLAIGSSGYRAAMDQTVEAAIVQNLRTSAGQLSNGSTNLAVSYYKDDGTLTLTNDPRALYYATNIVTNSTLSSTQGTNTLSQIIAVRYSIIHIPSKSTNAVGVIHIFPRAQ